MMVKLKNMTETFLSVPLKRGTISLHPGKVSAPLSSGEITASVSIMIQKGSLSRLSIPAKIRTRNKTKGDKQ